MLVAINNQNPQLRLIRRAVEVLKSGGVLIYPTDTVYGIGCDLFNKRGIERIYEILRRDRKKPLSFICADLRDISHYARVSDDAYKVMRRLLPGPYTFILEASRVVPKIILPKRQTTGIRIPDNRICQALLAEMGSPVISASVKDEGAELLSDPRVIAEVFGKRVDMIIDGGIIAAEPSSVISLIEGRGEIIREGKGDISAFR
ncbi:MAG: L-threonylcarbamoyladenylate synthase [Syntrophaceae bacterium]|nr:L-threonylcarbamoyladenylate synthase [Syntrophaceae bacterium]